MSIEAPVIVCVERENVNDDTVIIIGISVENGAQVTCDDVVLEFETSKTNIEVTAPKNGYVQLHVTTDEEILIGAPLFSVHHLPLEQITGTAQGKTTDSEPSNSLDDPQHNPSDSKSNGKALFSKPARERAAQLNVPLVQFADDTWVTVKDIEAAAGHRPNPIAERSQNAKISTAGSEIKNLSHPALKYVSYREKRKSKRKQSESANLTYHGNALPQSTLWKDIRVSTSRVVNPPYLFENSISDLVVYEASKLFKQYPALNGFDIDPKSYGEYEAVNFGMSFDGGNNLKVLAITDSDQKSLLDIQTSIESLLHSYESAETLEERILTSSTVTLSDLSPTDTSSMLPLLNGPQSLILGISRPDAITYSIAASFDHRVTEGFEVAEFLQTLSERILSYFAPSSPATDMICASCHKTMQEEVTLGNRGMISIKSPTGQDQLLCRNCFEGW